MARPGQQDTTEGSVLVTDFLWSSPVYVGETAPAGHLCHGRLSLLSTGFCDFLRALGLLTALKQCPQTCLSDYSNSVLELGGIFTKVPEFLLSQEHEETYTCISGNLVLTVSLMPSQAHQYCAHSFMGCYEN